MPADTPPLSPPSARPAGRAPASRLAKLGLAVGAPLILFLLLEAGLRLAGIGHDTRFFIPDGHPGVYRTNPHYTELFFPASFGLKPLNFRLPKHKPAGSFRVFVVGESAAMGVPEPGFAIVPQLRAQLRTAFPTKDLDVYNLGVTAINSHVVRHIVREAVGFQPDLLVVYMGNNEVVGPFAPSSAVANRTLPLPLIRVSLWVRGTRTGQLIQRLVQALAAAGHDFKDWRGMEMFAGKTVVADDPRLEAVYANFSANLADILAAAHDAGIKVIVSTVAVNVRDCAPFASQHRRALSPRDLQAWQATLDQAVAATELGEAGPARAAFERALAIDPEYADAHFLLAKFLEDRGEADAARRHYFEALQWDALRFRADARINGIIRRVAATAPGAVSLVDAAQALGSDATSTVAPAGHSLFFEHVHLTWDGNYALSRLLAARAAVALFGEGPAPSHWLSSTACADAIGFTDFGRAMMIARMAELTARPPFTGQHGFAADRARLQQEIAAANAALSTPAALQAAAAKVEEARRQNPGDPFLIFHAATVRERLRDPAGALDLNESLSAVQPPSPEQAAQRAFLLQELQRPHEAEEVLLESARADPHYFQTYGLLENLWAATAQAPKALGYFAALVARMPESRAARHTYAQALGRSGDWPGAEQQWEAVLRMAPDDEAALLPLVQRLDRRQKDDAAVDLMLKAYAYNPRNFANNGRLVQVFDERGDLVNTVKYMRALADSGPVKATLHFDLAVRLSKLGHKEEMMVELRRAQRAAATEGDGALLKAVNDLIPSR